MLKNLIRKILKESEDQFDWVRDIPHTDIEVLDDTYLTQYLEGNLDLTNFVNVLYNHNGVAGATEIMNELGEYIIQKVNKVRLNLHRGESNPHSMRRMGDDDRNRFAFSMYLLSMLDYDVLKDTFRNTRLHDEFGGVSYILRIHGKYMYIHCDNRGTSIEVEPNLTTDEFIRIMKTIIDETSVNVN